MCEKNEILTNKWLKKTKQSLLFIFLHFPYCLVKEKKNQKKNLAGFTLIPHHRPPRDIQQCP